MVVEGKIGVYLGYIGDIMGMDKNYVYADISDIWYKRLHIRIVRTGLTWVTDLRERKQWMKEFMRVGETAVISEIEPKYVYEDIVRLMVKADMTLAEMGDIFYRLSNKDYNLVNNL